MESVIGIIWGTAPKPRDVQAIKVSRADAIGQRLGASPVALLVYTQDAHLLTLALTEKAGRDLLLDLCVALDVPLPIAEPSPALEVKK